MGRRSSWKLSRADRGRRVKDQHRASPERCGRIRLSRRPDPALLRAGWVRFEPGARTFWHSHPLGQTLAIVSGIGHVQTWGGPIRQVRAGDTVWIPPGEKHWHGATPDHGMEHIAMQEAKDGDHVNWLEAVTDEQYKAKATG